MNLYKEINDQLENIVSFFIKQNKFYRLGKYSLASRDGLYLSFYPELLNYENDEEIFEIWIACKFYLNLEEESSTQMREFILSLPSKPLKIDKDHFLIVNHKDKTEYTCFFNKNYLNGLTIEEIL